MGTFTTLATHLRRDEVTDGIADLQRPEIFVIRTPRADRANPTSVVDPHGFLGTVTAWGGDGRCVYGPLNRRRRSRR